MPCRCFDVSISWCIVVSWFVGETIVHLMDPEYVKVVYMNEGKAPHVRPFVLTSKMYRKYTDMAPGLGNR